MNFTEAVRKASNIDGKGPHRKWLFRRLWKELMLSDAQVWCDGNTLVTYGKQVSQVYVPCVHDIVADDWECSEWESETWRGKETPTPLYSPKGEP